MALSPSVHNYNSLFESLIQFNIFLNSNEVDAKDRLKTHLKSYSKKRQINRNFHLITVGSDPKIEELFEQLFHSLNIDDSEWPIYFDPQLTVYQLLSELQKKTQSNELACIIRLIDKKLAYNKLHLIVLGLLLISTLLIVFLIPQIEEAIIAAIDLTIIGLIYTSSAALFKLRQNFSIDTPKTRFAKWRDSFFLVTNTLLNIIGYAIWIGSAAIMGPTVAGLFIAASVTEVLKELSLYIANYLRYSENKKSPTKGLSLSHNYKLNISIARDAYEYKKHRNAGIINLNAAFILVALITVWCFIPGGTVVTLGIVAAILVVEATKNMINKYINSCSKNKLNVRLELMHENYLEQRAQRPQLRSKFPPLTPTHTKQPTMMFFSPALPPQHFDFSNVTMQGLSDDLTSSGLTDSLLDAEKQVISEGEKDSHSMSC